MPVRKKTALKRQKILLSPSLLYYFQYGFPLNKALEGHDETLGLIFFDEGKEKLAALWRENYDSILADWIKKYPGTMPYYWHRLRGGYCES